MKLFERMIGRRAKPRLIRVVVYSRPACTCCHKALEVLERYRRKYELEITEIDVDTDPSLAERYGEQIPVVEIGGKIRFKGQVNPVLLERLLKAERRNSSAHLETETTHNG